MDDVTFCNTLHSVTLEYIHVHITDMASMGMYRSGYIQGKPRKIASTPQSSKNLCSNPSNKLLFFVLITEPSKVF